MLYYNNKFILINLYNIIRLPLEDEVEKRINIIIIWFFVAVVNKRENQISFFVFIFYDLQRKNKKKKSELINCDIVHWKKKTEFFCSKSFIKKINKLNTKVEKETTITWFRASTITSTMVGHIIAIRKFKITLLYT